MAILNIKITAPVQEFSLFADELGYQDLITKSDEELALLVEPISIQDRLKPNPETKEVFLTKYFKSVVTTELARVKIQAIQAQVDATKEAEKVAMRNAIEAAVATSFV